MTDLDDRVLARAVLTMRIIVLALVMGVLVFGVIACVHVFAERGMELRADTSAILSLVSMPVFAVGVLGSFLAPFLMFRHAQGQIAAGIWPVPSGVDPKRFEGDAPKLLAARQGALVVGLALLEGPAFLACVAFYIEAQVYPLPIAAVAVVLMLLRFPTMGGIRVCLEQDLDALKSLRA